MVNLVKLYFECIVECDYNCDELGEDIASDILNEYHRGVDCFGWSFVRSELMDM